jgi:hypothetical protein
MKNSDWSQQPNDLIHPKTLEPDQEYFVHINHGQGETRCFAQVTFADYTTCPAIVIMMDCNGNPQRILRDSIRIKT